MEIVTHRILYRGRTDTFNLIPIGDSHLGAKGCDETALEATIDRVAKDKWALTVLMGDLCDCITTGDKRWDDRAVASWCFEPWARANIAIAQRDRMIDMLKRIPREKILGLISGNHEATIRRTHQLDISLDIARTLGIPYLGEEGFVRLVFTTPSKMSRTVVIFATHGSGGGRKPGGKVNKMSDISAFIEADIILMGHHHERFGLRTVKLGVDKMSNLEHIEKVNAITGTYLKTYQMGAPSYAARELYPPTAIGSPVIHITPFYSKLDVTL